MVEAFCRHEFIPVYPGRQVQSVTIVLPGCEVEFIGHAWHASVPADALNVPAPHELKFAALAPAVVV